MEHPPKQGLKLRKSFLFHTEIYCFNGTSTKTRIETPNHPRLISALKEVLMEHPPKQGLKPRTIPILD